MSLNSFGKNSIIGFFTGFILQSAVILVIYLFSAYSIIRINSVSFLLPPLIYSLSAAVTEEIIVRGIVFRIMEEKSGSAIALTISALLFGILHLDNTGATFFSAISIALQAEILLGAAYIFSRSLWLPIFLHFGWNFTEGGIYGALISGNTSAKSLFTSNIKGPELITGGQFGPENSIQATIFCLIAGIVFLVLAKRQNKFIRPYWQNKTAADKSIVSGRA